jgi:hypothetical protein
MKIKKIQTIVKIFGFLTVILLEFFPMVSLAQTQTTDQRCTAFKNQFSLSNGVNIIGGSKVYCSGTELILAAINYATAISGTITILFLIVGGFMYVTSAGNQEQSERAQKILTNSIIGLVIITLAYTIVRITSSLLSLGK